jgi:hypothetical protein
VMLNLDCTDWEVGRASRRSLSHRLHSAGVQLRLGVDLSRPADRALHVLAHLGNRRARGQRHRRGIDVALAAAVAAVDPQQLVLAHEVAKRDGRSGDRFHIHVLCSMLGAT